MKHLFFVILATLMIVAGGVSDSYAEWINVRCTAYSPYDCGGITASGEYVHEGGVACNFLPLGTVVAIDGYDYIVNDRCGIDGTLDIFMESYDRAITFGVQYKDIYVYR